jgi:predicted enzyme related to lactoylglutathione lyase
MEAKENVVGWFEIPATDLKRAKKFYETIFETELQNMELGNGLKMAMFPVKEGGIGGALCEHKDFYKPSHDGLLVYLNADPDLQQVLDRIKEQGGKELVTKTQISEDYGYMAVFEDCEGNRVALHSMG